MIQFGRSYQYKDKIVYPIMISEDQIVCSDNEKNTYVITDKKLLIPIKKKELKIVVPNFIIKKPVAKISVPEEKVATINEIVKDEIEIVAEDKSISIEPVIVPTVTKPKKKQKIIITEEDYI